MGSIKAFRTTMTEEEEEGGRGGGGEGGRGIEWGRGAEREGKMQAQRTSMKVSLGVVSISSDYDDD